MCHTDLLAFDFLYYHGETAEYKTYEKQVGLYRYLIKHYLDKPGQPYDSQSHSYSDRKKCDDALFYLLEDMRQRKYHLVVDTHGYCHGSSADSRYHVCDTNNHSS